MFSDNKLTKLLNIKYPIIQGGMAGVSESTLVSAVSNAGGLGVIGSGFAQASWLEGEIKKTKLLTDKPFGVNLLMQNPKAADLVKVIINQKVPVVFTGGGNPLPIIPRLRQSGVKIIPVVPCVRLAAKMEQSGVDAVVVEGLESGGHIGESTTMCLVPQAKQAVKSIPIIAAGGICDGQTFAAALVLGADGAQIGTRFLAAIECQISESYKKAVINATDEDIVVVARFTGHPVRMIKNKFVESIRQLEENNPFPDEVKSERFVGNKGGVNADLSALLCGTCAGGIREIETCREIIEEMVNDAKRLLGSSAKLMK
ncbi:MAG: nitronate monooxygenase [Candidatus Paceibacterota bacterium]|jgi:enoyl-[acyl-carrier protein] reductase II